MSSSIGICVLDGSNPVPTSTLHYMQMPIVKLCRQTHVNNITFYCAHDRTFLRLWLDQYVYSKKYMPHKQL